MRSLGRSRFRNHEGAHCRARVGACDRAYVRARRRGQHVDPLPRKRRNYRGPATGITTVRCLPGLDTTSRLLRVSGIAYQFRHSQLQDWLTSLDDPHATAGQPASALGVQPTGPGDLSD